jgi:ribosome biogenesis ATPase
VYEEIIETLEAKDEDTDSDPYETTRIVDTPETRQTANESLRSMYSSNRTAVDSKIYDIMVIDVLGGQDMAPPQSTQVKKVNYIFVLI